MASNFEEDKIRKFESGATRDQDVTKPDYEGFISPLVIERYGQYMSKHRQQPDGQLRNSDNWQLGIPLSAYMKSAWRHFFDWWKQHRGYQSDEDIEESLCAMLFNVSGYLHEKLKSKQTSVQLNLVPSQPDPTYGRFMVRRNLPGAKDGEWGNVQPGQIGSSTFVFPFRDQVTFTESTNKVDNCSNSSRPRAVYQRPTSGRIGVGGEETGVPETGSSNSGSDSDFLASASPSLIHNRS